jgi:O-antigen biosynthesis protein
VPAFVIAVRNPMSVAASLHSRNGTDPTKAHLLWLEHIISALIESQGFRRVIVDYDRFIDDPRRELVRVAQAFGLDLSAECEVGIKWLSDEFLDSGLRHAHYTFPELARSIETPGDVVRLYEMLQRIAADRIHIDCTAAAALLDDLRNRVTDFAPAFRYISKLEGRAEDLCRTVEDRDQLLGELNKASAERELQIDQLRTCRSMGLGSALLSPVRSLRNFMTSRRWRVAARGHRHFQLGILAIC